MDVASGRSRMVTPLPAPVLTPLYLGAGARVEQVIKWGSAGPKDKRVGIAFPIFDSGL